MDLLTTSSSSFVDQTSTFYSPVMFPRPTSGETRGDSQQAQAQAQAKHSDREEDEADLRSLESKLELLRIQRQISAAKCEAFLAELESCQAGTTSSRSSLHSSSAISSRRRSLDSSHSVNSRRSSRRSSRSQQQQSSGNLLLRSPGSRAPLSASSIPITPRRLSTDSWDVDARDYFRSRSYRA